MHILLEFKASHSLLIFLGGQASTRLRALYISAFQWLWKHKLKAITGQRAAVRGISRGSRIEASKALLQSAAQRASWDEIRKKEPWRRVAGGHARSRNPVTAPAARDSSRSKWRRGACARAPRGSEQSGTRPGARGRAQPPSGCAPARGGGGLCLETSCSCGAGRVREDGGPGECRLGSRGSRRGCRACGHLEVHTARGRGSESE